MEEIATYYVTLKPIRKGANPAEGMKNIAFVPDPAIEEIGIYLNKQDARIVADENIQKAILEYLATVGIEKPSHWKEVTEEEYLSAKELSLTTDPTSRESVNDFTNKEGTGQWLVRYEYSGPKDSKNRSFCSEVLSLGRIYTEEEIKNGLSNSEFGNYSIWDYKGSYGCRHVWKRLIFFEDFEDGQVRRVGNVPQVTRQLDDSDARTLNAFLSKDEKMQVVAPILIPEKRIFRNDELGRWNMVFTKETILELREASKEVGLFEKSDLFKDTHNGGTAPSYVIDEWITESEDDKAYTEYGFSLAKNPIGTWFVHSQVTDKEYWEKEIKANKKHAYSIEAIMNLSIIKLSKMEEQKIMLPDGEHLINGTIYVVENGVVVATKEVTPEQEAVVEEVAETAAEEANAEELAEEKKPEEMAEEPKPEAMETAAPDEDRLSKLEKNQEELLQQIAELKAQLEKPKEEDVTVEMSDNRPIWKKISDGLNVIKNQK